MTTEPTIDPLAEVVDPLAEVVSKEPLAEVVSKEVDKAGGPAEKPKEDLAEVTLDDEPPEPAGDPLKPADDALKPVDLADDPLKPVDKADDPLSAPAEEPAAEKKEEVGSPKMTEVSLDDDPLAQEASPPTPKQEEVSLPKEEPLKENQGLSLDEKPKEAPKEDVKFTVEPEEKSPDATPAVASPPKVPANFMADDPPVQEPSSEKLPSSGPASPSQDSGQFPQILKAELAGNWFNKYVLFVIKLPGGQEIRRRFTDFWWLRGVLTKRYVGAFIPPLPARLPVAMWPKGYLQTRKRELQRYLKRCAMMEFIKEDDVWTVFLTTPKADHFEKERKKWDKSHAKASIRSTCELLEKTFPNIMNEPLPTDLDSEKLEGRFEDMQRFVNTSVGILKKLFKEAQAMVDTCVVKVDAMMTMRENLKKLEDTTKNRFSDLRPDQMERLMRICPTAPTPISKSIASWCQAMHEVPTQLDVYLVHNIKRNLMDFEVLADCCAERAKVVKQLSNARIKAAKWKNVESLRSNQVSQKHADELLEQDLDMLAKITYKLVTKQFVYVWQANQHRFSGSITRLKLAHEKKYAQLARIWKSTISLLNPDQATHESAKAHSRLPSNVLL